MQEAEKTRSSRTKRDSSKVRGTDTKSKSKTDAKPSSRSTRSKSNSKGKPEEKEPYTKPSPRTLRKSSSSNAKVDLKATPPNTTITKVKKPSKPSAQAGDASKRSFSKSKDAGKPFSTSKGSSKTSSPKAASDEAKVSSKGRRSSEFKSSLDSKSSKDVSRRKASRDESSSLRNTTSSRNSLKDKTKELRRSNEKSRTERSKEPKDDGRKERSKRGERSKERKGSHEKKQNKSDANLPPPSQPPPDQAETILEESKLEAGDGEVLMSLDTQESGISVSSPRPPMSRDDSVEEEVEASISSKFVEVGDAEEVDEMIAEEPEITIEEEPEITIEEEPEIAIEEEPEIVIEEEPEIAELSEDSGVAGTEGSSGFEAHAEFLETKTEIPETAEAPAVEEVDDAYEDDDFEDYESDFEDTEDEEDEDEEGGSKQAVLDENESENDYVDEDNDEGDLTTDDEADAPHTEEASAQPHQSVRDGPEAALVLQDAIRESMRQDNSDGTSKPERPKTSKSFVNFAKLKEKHGVNQTAQVDNRGLTLLSMITLDTVSLDLLTLQPINYDAFISSFGLTNTQQASSQTNEDNLSQETQTDDVTMLTKWTQQPICVNVGNLEEPPTPQDYLGVGGEMAEIAGSIDSFSSKASGNVGRLTKFLAAASQVVLSLLEEESVYRSSSDYENGSLGHGTGGGGFSNHGVLLGGTSSDTTPSFGALLANSAVMCMRFSASDASVVATGHSFSDENTAPPDTETDYSVAEKSSSGLVVVWSVHEPSLPKYILRCNSTPKTLAFSPGRPLLVMAGLADSTLAVWDLKEPGHVHPNMTIDKDYNLIHVDLTEERGDPKNSALVWRCRVPSFITACSDSDNSTHRSTALGHDSESSTSKGAKKKSKHNNNPMMDAPDAEGSTPEPDTGPLGSPIICLQTVDVAYEEEHAGDSNAFQVVSLSSHGELVWWVVVSIRDRLSVADEGSEVSVSAHSGASPWSRVTVTKAFSYAMLLPNSADLYNRVGCTDCQLSPSDPSTVYVSTDSGAVRHINRLNNRTNPQAFLPEMEPACSATCACVCPHLPSYLLVGCSDGSVRLHSLSSARPLTTWPPPDLNNPRPVVQITWSHERPCVFYVHEHERIHVWDLSAGDMSPVTSLDTDALMGETGPMIFSLAPARLFNRDVVNAMFGSRSGRLILRKVESDFLSESPDEKEMELERFKFYATII